MNDRGQPRRPGAFFDFRQENGAWSIHDNRRGTTAVVNGVPQAGLGLSEAEELTAILNRIEAQRAAHQAGREG